ncbi:MAG TPA: BMP family ABC transporter substrate-binding protein [Candidatus Atribacteria bacterium]|nr:BMP family ABC transporter substrate-binding protein [Candidatus Atribacteria bacterium]HBY56325.1 BMP family ABC transporter substrate-binding protein [Candidatus Atribacteria bacterium]
MFTQRNKVVLVTTLIIVVIFSLTSVMMAKEYVPGTPLKAGFIYVGPIGDLGWSYAHDEARRICDDTFPWLETVYVEAVPEGSEGLYIDKLIREEGCDVIFTTSFGFMDGTLISAQKYPDKIFAHCSGFKRNPNMMTYMADFYQIYYLNGLIAGALTKTNKTAYVGAFPIPELKRHMGAFTVGVREAKPKAEVHIRWIYEWFSPTAAKEAAEALIADGCDVFAFTEDSPTVVQVAAEKGFPSFGHYSPMYDFSPEHVVSGQIAHWEEIYLDFLAKVYAGVYTAHNLADVDYWWLLKEKAVEMGAKPGMLINPTYEDKLKAIHINDPVLGMISVYDLVLKRLEQMADPSMVFDPFNGPVYDREGNLKVPEGLRMSVFELTTMDWAVDGIVGPWE